MTAGDRVRLFQSGEIFKPGQPLAPRIVGLKGQLGTLIDIQPDGVTGGALVALNGGEYFIPYAMLELAPAE